MASPSTPRTNTSTDSTNTRARRDRPCDACRKRKSRCVLPENAEVCVLCAFHKQECRFIRSPQPRKRKLNQDGEDSRRLSNSTTSGARNRAALVAKAIDGQARDSVDDYANLKGPSLLKKTLGLQHHRHSNYLGLSAEYEPALLNLHQYDDKDECQTSRGTLRKASEHTTFLLLTDRDQSDYKDEYEDLDAIEALVSPYGQSLINLYFRVVHPSFPVLHKRVYLEKYSRSHREFSPPLLAAVYILALNWWGYSTDLAPLKKPDVGELTSLAVKTIGDILYRPKLSGIQAGLLLLQSTEGRLPGLIPQLVAIASDVGLHLDCTDWKIPQWEKGLRKRLAWALYAQDKWSSLIHGRPSHIMHWNWVVRDVTDDDFPENAADEDDEEGSTEVEKGRSLFREMIGLTRIVSDILDTFYTIKAIAENDRLGSNSIHTVLERAKPIQLQLKNWYMNLPSSLKMSNIKARKLSSSGYLHLAYFTAEISLHRCIIRSLSQSQAQTELRELCRSAAKSRLSSAIDFVNSLRQEHLQAFWFSASRISFALIGTFGSFLWATSSSPAEAEFYKTRLAEYRWTLRISSKGSGGLLEFAVATLDSYFTLLQNFEPQEPQVPFDSEQNDLAMESVEEETEDEILEDNNTAVEPTHGSYINSAHSLPEGSLQYFPQDAGALDEMAFMNDNMLWVELPYEQGPNQRNRVASEQYQIE